MWLMLALDIYVDDKSKYIAPSDPDHSVPATTFGIFGTYDPFV